MIRFVLLSLIFASFFFSSTVNAQTSLSTPAAPIPPELLSAKRIFISNAGGDSGLFPQPFSGTPARGYDEFYEALRAWGHYNFVSSPGQADLVFELRLFAPNGPTSPNKTQGASEPVPMFRLVIFDEKTHYILWTITESIEQAFRQKSHDRNFHAAITALVRDLKTMVAGPAQH